MSKPFSVVTLGSFDGVHRGHQQILHKVVSRARHIHARSVALAFGMPPRLSRSSLPAPMLLTTLKDKLQILKRLGIDQTEVLVFDRATASTPPERFFQKRILGEKKAREMVVGPRVAFGKNRAGKLPMLKRLGRKYGVKIHIVQGVKVGGKPVSSSQIREYLHQGDVEAAKRQLGYPYSVSGKVIHGSHRGRQIGFPTANVAVDRLKILPPGVFWVKCMLVNERIPLSASDLKYSVDGLCNIGTRPTFSPQAKDIHCEVFLFRKPTRLYGKELRVVFLKRIRSEKRFKSAEALRRQITRDFQKARAWARS